MSSREVVRLRDLKRWIEDRELLNDGHALRRYEGSMRFERTWLGFVLNIEGQRFYISRRCGDMELVQRILEERLFSELVIEGSWVTGFVFEFEPELDVEFGYAE